MIQEAKEGKIKLGGCMVTEVAPHFHCKNCHKDFWFDLSISWRFLSFSFSFSFHFPFIFLSFPFIFLLSLPPFNGSAPYKWNRVKERSVSQDCPDRRAMWWENDSAIGFNWVIWEWWMEGLSGTRDRNYPAQRRSHVLRTHSKWKLVPLFLFSSFFQLSFSFFPLLSVISFQENLLKTMLSIERTFFDLGRYESERGKNVLIICDRGSMDPSACTFTILIERKRKDEKKKGGEESIWD